MYPLLVIGGVAIVAGWTLGFIRIGKPREHDKPNDAPPNHGTPRAPSAGAVLPFPVIVPAIPTLPPMPLGALPAIPFPGVPLPQIDSLPPEFVPGVLDGDTFGPIVRGDIINVDMFRSGMAIPQNLPVVGKVFMRVVDLAVPGDSVPRKLLRAEFISPEFMILGEQNIRRDSAEKMN